MYTHGQSLHPSSFCLACFTLTSEPLRVLVDFVTVFPPSGWNIVLICSLTPLAYGRCRSLGGVWLSMVVLVGVGLPIRLLFTTCTG